MLDMKIRFRTIVILLVTIILSACESQKLNGTYVTADTMWGYAPSYVFTPDGQVTKSQAGKKTVQRYEVGALPEGDNNLMDKEGGLNKSPVIAAIVDDHTIKFDGWTLHKKE